MRKRVQAYFDEKGITSAGTPNLFTKAIAMIVALVLVYLHLLFFTPVWYLAIVECIIMGGLVAGIGFNVMHDGSHGSFSTKKLVNKIAATSINMLGADHFMWNMKHNMIHHTFTNIDGVDDDIEIGVMMRMAPTQKRLKMHKFQHFYFCFCICCCMFFGYFLRTIKIFYPKNWQCALKPMALKDHFTFWAVKIYHAFAFIVLPIITVGWLAWLVGFLVMTSVAGFVLSIVFQLAHTVEHTAFPVADIDSNKMDDEFAIHQIKTTANFATTNKLVSWLVGGLNFQIEHHLFPKFHMCITLPSAKL